MYKDFDWEEAKKRNSPEKYELLKKIHKEKIDVDEYIRLILDIPRKKMPRRPAKQYRRLKEVFGFFQG